MALTDEQIIAIIRRYANNVQNADQKEAGWMITAMRRALSDYWPDEQMVRQEQSNCIANLVADALDIKVPTKMRDMLEQVVYMKAELERIKK